MFLILVISKQFQMLFHWFLRHILVFGTGKQTKQKTTWQLDWPRRKHKVRKPTAFFMNCYEDCWLFAEFLCQQDTIQVLILQVEATSRGNSMSLAAEKRVWRSERESHQILEVGSPWPSAACNGAASKPTRLWPECCTSLCPGREDQCLCLLSSSHPLG